MPLEAESRDTSRDSGIAASAGHPPPRALGALIPRWRLRVTNFGLGYILVTLLVAIAATNTANNGLYTVLAGLLAAMIVSGVVSRRNLRVLTCTVEPAGEIFAGKPGGIAVTIENRSTSLTAQGIWFLHEALPRPLYVAPLAPGESRRYALEAVFARRGVYADGDAGLMSRFPVGLFRKYRRAAWPRPVVVYPDPVRSSRRQDSDDSSSGLTAYSMRRGFGAELRTLREFVSGDDVRDLHWKQSARLQKWIVRERQDERSRRVVFFVENAVADPLDPESLGRVERSISATAGEALALLESGGEAGLAARGISVAPGGGAGQRRRILEALAHLEIHPLASAPPMPSLRPGDRRRDVA
jgi:uncharacterized protein (DUF58 family)